MFVYLPLDTYLRQWWVHDLGGTEPVILPKYSIERNTLEIVLAARPAHVPPKPQQPGEVAVVIPDYRTKPPERFNFLSRAGELALTEKIRQRFDVQLFRDLYHVATFIERQDHTIIAWMENHGIEVDDTNYNAVVKRFQKLARRARENAARRKSSKKSTKS